MKKMGTIGKKKILKKISLMLGSALVLGTSGTALAVITGVCSNCHTMHNSQDGSPMTLVTSTAQPMLVKGDCVGCHAQGGATKIAVIGQIPQVSHTDGSGDLAGGNFAYIAGTKGTGASAAKGHNVIDLFGVNSDAALNLAPGIMGTHGGYVGDTILTCAGEGGCHGVRASSAGKGLNSLKGSHHGNVDGKITSPTTVATSYRFLNGVKGVENAISKWQNINATDHNEYFGSTSPKKLGCSGQANASCHGANGIMPPQNTISEFCGTCHANFHSLTSGSLGIQGIGATTSSPFLRHPTDVIIKNSGEYAAYTNYNVDAPVGRTVVPDAASGAVTPDTDVVTCMSCHKAHATDYPDLLRWSYNQNAHSNAGNNSNDGCFICHTTKDDAS